MKTIDIVSGCACCGMNRRKFLAAGCAACAGAAGLALSVQPLRASEDREKLRIRVVYSLHAPNSLVRTGRMSGLISNLS